MNCKIKMLLMLFPSPNLMPAGVWQRPEGQHGHPDEIGPFELDESHSKTHRKAKVMLVQTCKNKIKPTIIEPCRTTFEGEMMERCWKDIIIYPTVMMWKFDLLAHLPCLPMHLPTCNSSSNFRDRPAQIRPGWM